VPGTGQGGGGHGWLAVAVRPWEALDKQPDKERRWEADDVQVVALDPLDQGTTQALDRIAARSSLPLAAPDVVGQVTCGQRSKRHLRRLAVPLLPGGSPQAEARHDLVRPSRQALEHRPGRGRIRRLAERLA